MKLARPTAPTSTRVRCPVVELRRYTMRPGQRDVLIELFDREFVEPQEALGMSVIGQFRDLDDADQYVWLRGFDDMESRAGQLNAFYREGAVWKAHRAAANATMIDSDNVLLLKPASEASGFPEPVAPRAPIGATRAPESILTATIEYFGAPVAQSRIDRFERTLVPLLVIAGATPLGAFVTEPSVNTFPALPVRENVNVLVSFLGFPSEPAHEAHLDALLASDRWTQALADIPPHQRAKRTEGLRLSPTARSLLRG